MSSIDEVKERTDIVELVSETVELRRSGKSYTGFCPFHHNTRTPSFVVFPDTSTWRCFGQCGEGGDAFKFVMKRDGVEFGDSLRLLAERAGVELRPPTPQEKERDDENDRLRLLLEDSVTFYRHQLLQTEAGKPALEYLHSRGLSDETIENFGLGYAPDAWEATSGYFQKKGVPAEDLVAVGLIGERDSGGYFDKFRHRVMFPIRDSRGRMTGFGARALRADERAKYLNSPQTVLYDKSSLLYGLDKARKPIRAEDQVVIVEGYLDVIALHQAGHANAVSPMGTALTEAQLRLLKRLTRRIVLALDSDAAGNKATLRGLQVARETLDRETEISFDARGLLHKEARLKADIRVTTLPEGKDPDEVIQENPDAWVEILKASRPIVAHVMESLAAGRDLDDPKIKTEIASQVLPLIQDLPSAIERDTYIQQLARLLRVDERSLLTDRTTRSRAKPRRRRPPRTADMPAPPPVPGVPLDLTNASQLDKLEVHCLGIVMRLPELLFHVDRALVEAGLERISIRDFLKTKHQEMFRISQESIDQDFIEPLNFAMDNLPLPMLETADEILTKTAKLDVKEQRVFDDLLRTILYLRRAALRQRNDQLRYLQEEAQENGDRFASQYQQATLLNARTISQLDKAIGKFTNRSAAVG